jgi:3-oxoacyl-(acyl-carrier-protein) synthase III
MSSLEEAPRANSGETPEPPQADGLPCYPLLISAKSEQALCEQAGRLQVHLLENPKLAPLDVAFSLATTRAQLERRAAILGNDREALLAGLRSLAHGALSAKVVRGAVKSGRTAFMFTGQGAQRPGMGTALARAFPVFDEALEEICAELNCHTRRSLKELMFAPKGTTDASLLDQTEFTQPALFALEVALFRLLESFALKPDFLIGHSVGELAAAHVAGVLGLADACALVAARGRLMGALPTGGAMLAVQASEQEAADALQGLGEEIALAAVNGPAAVVLSGDAGVIECFQQEWEARGRKSTRLNVSHAFHSPSMAPMLEEFRAVADGVRFEHARIPMISNVSGTLAGTEQGSAEYWVRHVRDTVRFADGIAALERAGVTRFLELGPGGVLSAMARGCLGPELEQDALLVPAMRANREEPETLVAFLAAAHTDGVGLEWEALFAGKGARTIELPRYAFQRSHYARFSTGSTRGTLLRVASFVPRLHYDAAGPWGQSAHDPIALTERPGPRCAQREAAILSLATALPAGRLTNAELAVTLGLSEEWILSRTGIRERCRADLDERLSDYATRAGEAALAQAGLTAAELDLVVVGTMTSDELTPNTAPIVADALGAWRAGAFDVGAACNAFLTGMALAAGQIECGRADHVLVVGADFITRITDYADPRSAPLFGDAAGAVVLGAARPDGGRIGPIVLGADGSRRDAIVATHAERVLRVRGAEVYQHAVNRMSEVTLQALAAAELELEQVDLFVYHQANGRITRALGERLGLVPERVVDCIELLGNASAATLPIALAHAHADGRLHQGARVLLCSFGAGFTWGAGTLEWSAGDPGDRSSGADSDGIHTRADTRHQERVA